ncbi:MAG: FG-GAP-like repeat-containing protein [Candidatus Eisenbacteria bacterium]
MFPATFLRQFSNLRLTISPDIIVTLFLATVLPGFLAVRTAQAQYMYLDSNGDGVNTAADVITAAGPTTFDVWLRTDKRRDGSDALCSNGTRPLTINSYEVVVRASGGTVTWGARSNLQSGMSIDLGSRVAPSSTEMYMGFLGPTILPPGDYKLCRVSVSALSGTPSLGIVAQANTLSSTSCVTEFGSQCDGLDFDNTLKLGQDWFDTDGLVYSLGETSNSPPSIAAVSPMSAVTGEVTSQDVGAVDPNGDVVSLSLQTTTPIPTLALLSSTPGSASARLHARPFRHDAGDYTATLTAADEEAASTATVSVRVTEGPGHLPVLLLPPKIRMIAGTALDLRIAASDSDGDPIAFAKAEGPAFARVITQGAGLAATAGRIYLRPTVCDVGTWTLSIRGDAADGSAEARTSVEVLPASIPTAAPPAPALTLGAGVATGDFDGDGIQDAAVARETVVGTMVVFRGDGAGGLTPIGEYPLGLAYRTLESGDWNSDGSCDLAAGSFSSGPLKIFYGARGGAFAPAVDYPEIVGASGLRRADVNGDGRDDLVVSSEGTLPAVLLGTGGAGLIVASRIPAGGMTKDVCLGDFDSDGYPDVALAGWSPSRLILYRGRGDGTFGSPSSIPLAFNPYGICSGDFNEDGRLDIATSAAFGDQIVGVFGDGRGGFTVPSMLVRGPSFTDAIVATDWNADGHLDLYSTTESGPSQIYLGRGNGTFADTPALGSTGGGRDVTATDMNDDGRPDLVLVNGTVTVVINRTPFAPSADARAYQENTNRAIPTTQSSTTMNLRLEPVAASFTVTDVDAASVRLRSPGTGSVESIFASTAKSAVVGDTDGNSVQELPVSFAMTDVSKLFSLLHGKQSIMTTLDGSLADGRRFCTRVTLTIVAKGSGTVAARVKPNPLNPEGTLRFGPVRAGEVTVRLFDLNGRLVRTLLERKFMTAGPSEVRIDGKDSAGRTLRSGVYFYRIDGAGLNETGRFTILK